MIIRKKKQKKEERNAIQKFIARVSAAAEEINNFSIMKNETLGLMKL